MLVAKGSSCHIISIKHVAGYFLRKLQPMASFFLCHPFNGIGPSWQEVDMGLPIFIWPWVNTNGTNLGLGAPPISVYFSGDWDVHWGYGVLTHSHLDMGQN